MVQDKMDMSLDDIISAGRKGGKGGDGGGRGGGRRGGSGGGGGGVRRGGGGRGGRQGGGGGGRSRSVGANAGARYEDGYNRGNPEGKWSHDMYRTGGGAGRRGGDNMVSRAFSSAISEAAGPIKLSVTNLDFGVSDADIHELFSEFGSLKIAQIHYDRSGRSLGTADVIYDKRSDAVKAMKQYNGVPLDGKAMTIELAGGDQDSRGARDSPVRRLTGGRLGKREDTRRSPGRRMGGGGGRREGGGRGARRGGGDGGGRGGGKREQKPAASQEQLDAEMEEYMKAK